ncbi:hypothetical protein [Oceanospirillum sediminis]|uniref:Uncharacterized protein n=1 Tax=Oceanospirillum sediminis TaxID=2760088 RepID=A0A839IS14_9GAMM|nr:hypothetical protein [Oceanospirillum sediminis]MBB1487758.1 hypothetical protein [Oceanospirillum sediminis]
MDLRIYTRSKMAADSRSMSVDRSAGTDFSQIYTHSVAGQGRQGESDRYKDRAQDVISQRKFKDSRELSFTSIGVQDLPLDAARKFYQVRLQYGIPLPPEELSFDAEGNLILPADYPYAYQMKQAFEQSPDLRRMIQEYSVQASSFAEIQSRMPFADAEQDDVARARFEQMVRMSSYKRTV